MGRMSYTDQERAIFKYFDGAREVYGDPLALWREFTAACGGNPKQWMEWAFDESQPLRHADYNGKVIQATRAVFRMVPYDRTTNEGAQDHHVQAALEGLFAFFDQKKTSKDSEPTCTPSTAA